MMKKLFLIAYIDTLQKSSCLSEIKSVLITFAAINYEEMLRKDFTSKYFLEVNVVVIRTKPSSMISNMLASLFFELVIVYP